MPTPYPTAFPVAEITEIIAAIRNPTGLNYPALVHDGWVIVGYGLGQSVGPALAVAPDADLPTILETALAAQQGRQSVGGVPWRTIAMMILALLNQWVPLIPQ